MCWIWDSRWRVLRYRDATQQAEEDYPFQPCGISHFSQIILAYELKTDDLQDLDLSTTWAQLEFSWVMHTQSGSGNQRKNFGTGPGRAMWCPHLRLVTGAGAAYMITLRHCRPYRGYYHWASPLCREGVRSELIPWRMDWVWPGSTSHIATMTCSQPQEHETWKWILIIHLTRFCLYLLCDIQPSPDSSDTSQCFELIKNSLRWVHEGPGAKGLSGCWGALEPWACTTNANHCLLSRKSAGRAGVAMGDWSDPTFHCGHILLVFICCKAHTGPTLFPSQLWRALVSDWCEHRGLSGYLLSSYLDILWLAANVGNYFKIRGNQSNDYTLITASLMIMIIMTLPDPRLLPPPSFRATFCLFESLDLDWCEMRRAGTGATGQSSLVFALTTAPLLHWPHIMRRDAGHWYIHHPMHAPGLGLFCSRWAWQMAGPKFGVHMMDSE